MTSTTITDYYPSFLQFSVRQEAFHALNHPEDGEPIYGTVVYVSATANNGVRWVREVGGQDWIVDHDDFGEPVVIPQGDLAEAVRKADELADRLTKRSLGDGTVHRPLLKLNDERWIFAGAVYGSQAYVDLGLEEEDLYLDAREADWS